MPSGVITLWYGSSDAVPDGWTICNGENGTPDLRDRFVIGAGSNYTTGATGGTSSATATLSGNTGATTLSVDQIPSHRHGIANNNYYATTSGGEGDAHYACTATNINSANTGGGSSHTHSLSGSVNVSVLPPYYALFYIMKL